MKEMTIMFCGLILLCIGLSSYILLGFAFRDFSIKLLVMFISTPICIVGGFIVMNLSTQLNNERPKPMAIKVNK